MFSGLFRRSQSVVSDPLSPIEEIPETDKPSSLSDEIHIPSPEEVAIPLECSCGNPTRTHTIWVKTASPKSVKTP